MSDKTVQCLNCEEMITVKNDLEIGDVLLCSGCNVELEVINLDPLELDYLLVEK